MLTADVAALTQALRQALPQLVETVALLVVAIVVLSSLSLTLAAVAAVGLPLVAVAGHRFRKRSGIVYPQLRAAVAETVATFTDSVRGLATTQAFGRETEREAALATADGRRLKARAALQGQSLSEFALTELQRSLERHTSRADRTGPRAAASDGHRTGHRSGPHRTRRSLTIPRRLGGRQVAARADLR